MSPHHQTHSQQTPSVSGHRPDTIAGYLALHREDTLARATQSQRVLATTDAPRSNSPLLRALAPTVGGRLRELLTRPTVSARPAPAAAAPATRLGAAPGDLACCA